MERNRLVWVIFVLTLAGLVISGYLTWYSLVTPVGVCPLTGYFTCSAVLSSTYSRISGIPVAILGLFWFLIAAGLSLLITRNRKWLRYLLAWSIPALVGVFALEYVEIFLIGANCPLCTSAHVLGIAILALTLSLWWSGRSKKTD